MKLISEKIETLVLDVLFPVHCLLCGKDGFWICPECAGKIKTVSEQFCPYCEKYLSWKGEICSACQKKHPVSKRLDALVVGADYQNKDIARIIHYYKYNFLTELSQPLGEVMLRAFRQNQIPLPYIIIPVPLHRRRLKWRGFNQAELLANFLSENLAPGMILDMRSDILMRKSHRPPQKKIKEYKKRKANLEGIFSIDNPEVIKKREILLVDDVATTGSTLFECAKVLKKAGAKKVTGIVVARQNFSKNNV